MHYFLTWFSKAGAILNCWHIGCIFYLNEATNLIINHLPVFFFNFLVGLSRLLLLETCRSALVEIFCDFLVLFKCVAFEILIEGLSLQKFLQYLIARLELFL